MLLFREAQARKCYFLHLAPDISPSPQKHPLLGQNTAPSPDPPWLSSHFGRRVPNLDHTRRGATSPLHVCNRQAPFPEALTWDSDPSSLAVLQTLVLSGGPGLRAHVWCRPGS